MSSTRIVPETRLMSDEQLCADHAWQTLRREGGWHLLRDAFTRFRYGDGFSHSRAFAFQLCLAVVPFLIALTGLISELGVAEGGEVVADTVLALTPGTSDQMVAELLGGGDDAGAERVEEAGEVALTLGMITGLVALTSTMAQIERGPTGSTASNGTARRCGSTCGPPCLPSPPVFRRWPGSSSWSAVGRWATRWNATTPGVMSPERCGTWCVGHSAWA